MNLSPLEQRIQVNSSSFRDPSGFIFEHQGDIYRNISKGYSQDYEQLTGSGLLEKLFDLELLVQHEVVTIPDVNIPNSLAIIKPQKLKVISYPYEWSFTQLKDAALLTLEILQLSLEHGLILKDATAFNVQFIGSRPVFIDTLSFTKYEEGQSWSGYRQFCEFFLAPLSLSAYRGVKFQTLLRLGVEGVPLKLTSEMLPASTWLKPSTLFHIHLHAKTIDRYSESSKPTASKAKKIAKGDLLALIDHLRRIIQDLKLSKHDATEWKDYDKQTHYSDIGKQSKAAIVKEFVDRINPRVVWDAGANDGYFSSAAASDDRIVLSLDSDPHAVDKNYNLLKESKSQNIYPLLFDLVNPSPDMGWANRERVQLNKRSKPDVIMALAVIHHLVISNNIPFEKVAEYLSGLTEWLILEYVPAEDDKIKPLPETAGKSNYNRSNFDEGFFRYFDRVEEREIDNSKRSIILLKRKE